MALIESGAKHFPNSAVCWSGGKDSMTLLHLLRRVGLNLPLIFFREPWQPHKYRFQESVIQEWDLLVYTWHPYESAMQQKDDEWEVQNWYRINNSILTCPSGITPPQEDMPYVCAIDMLKRPKQSHLLTEPIDAAWVGHKRCDSDPVLGGDAGTRVEGRIMPEHMSLLFPIRDWTHDDVWNYIEEYSVPWDKGRYEKVNGKYREKPKKRYNADYVHACTACVDSRENSPKIIYCPKLGFEIESNLNKVPWVEPEKMSYMND